MRRAPLHGSNAFSLLELLVVAALLVVITTLYFGSSSSSHQRDARKSCQLQLQRIFLGMEIYANDNAGKFPAIAGAKSSEEPLDLLVPRYTTDTESFICPGGKDLPLPPGDALRNHKISYACYMGRRSANVQEPLISDAQVNTNSKSAGAQIFSTTGDAPANNHQKSGGNILFGDGSAVFTPPHLAFSLTLTQGVLLLNPKP